MRSVWTERTECRANRGKASPGTMLAGGSNTALALLVAGVLTVMPAPSSAQEPAGKTGDASLGAAGEWGVALGMGLFWFGPDLFKAQLSPDPCRWCDEGESGAWDPPSWDRATNEFFRADSPFGYKLASDVAVFGLFPISLAGIELLEHGSVSESFAEDVAIIGQAVAAAGMVNQVVKYSVGRKRPYAHHHPRPFEEDPDQNLSFYSGHTSAAFAQVVALATALYKDNSPYAPWTLAVGLPLAAGVGCLRMAADKHYFTDVLIGAVVGSLVGWGWVEWRR